MILDKENKTFIQFYDQWKEKLYTRDNCPESEFCLISEFVDQMTNDLLAKIDGISYFDSGKPYIGHILLLNIDSKPMFCIVLEGEELFPNVNKKNILFSL